MYKALIIAYPDTILMKNSKFIICFFMEKKPTIKHFFNIWIETINLSFLFLVLFFSIYQVNLLYSELLIPESRYFSLIRGIILFHGLWLLLLIQIPVFLYFTVNKELTTNEYFKFQILKIHWIRTCFSMSFAFLALLILQYTSGIDLQLTSMKIIITGIAITLITITGIFFFSKSFYANHSFPVISGYRFFHNQSLFIVLAISSIMIIIFIMLLLFL